MKICSYKIQRIPDNEFELFIPTETIYCFQTGIRRALKIQPIYTSWNMDRNNEPEYVYNLKVTEVHQCYALKIECTTYNVSKDSIERIWNSETRTPFKSILEMLNNEDYNIRSKEQFEADFNNALESIENY